MEERPPRQSALRRGRRSLAGYAYLVTTTTIDRRPVFSDLPTARHVVHTLRTSDQLGHSSTLAYVVMPDHLHWLLVLGGCRSLSVTVAAVKSISARNIGERVWQTGFHDYGVRRDDDLKRLARYVVANPLRAGLVDEIGAYPHWDAVWLPG